MNGKKRKYGVNELVSIHYVPLSKEGQKKCESIDDGGKEINDNNELDSERGELLRSFFMSGCYVGIACVIHIDLMTTNDRRL